MGERYLLLSGPCAKAAYIGLKIFVTKKKKNECLICKSNESVSSLPSSL
jgi:hypothetical protein